MTDGFKNYIFDGRKSPVPYIKKHAVLITFAVTLALSAASFCEQNYISPGNTFFILAGFIALSLVASVFSAVFYGVRKPYAVILFLFSCAVSYLLTKYLYAAERKAGYIFIVGIFFLAAAVVFLAVTRKLTVTRAIVVIFAAGFLLRFMYVLYTSVYTRQHDVGSFDDYYGHAGYIHYIFEYGHLPDFDVSTVDQFYHPPLHHIICALWWKILSSIGIMDAYSLSSLQTLTLFYSATSLIIIYKIFVRLGLKGVPLVAAFAIMAFHPTFVIFSASVNNDILSVTFMLLAVLYSIKWYGSRKFSDIIITAIAVGLGMMTKTSAYLVAFGIGFLFLYALIKDKDNYKKYLVQFAVFAIVCAPLALWWNVKNSIAYDMPLAYVQRQGEGSNWQYVGDRSVFERLFDFSKLFEAPVFDQWTNRGGRVYNEYNPMISLLKTAMFGEYINDYDYPAISFSASTLFASNFILAVASVACVVYAIVAMIRRKNCDILYLSIIISYFAHVVFYYIFCFTYPHHCTENIRYVSLLTVFGALFIGRTLCDIRGDRSGIAAVGDENAEGNENADGKRAKKRFGTVYDGAMIAVCLVVTVFAVSSSIMFLQIALR